MVSFESGLGLIVNVYCKLEGNHKKSKTRSIVNRLRKEKKTESYIRLKTNKRQEKQKIKIGMKNSKNWKKY